MEDTQKIEETERQPIVWRWTKQGGYLPFTDANYKPRKDGKSPSVDDCEVTRNHPIDVVAALATASTSQPTWFGVPVENEKAFFKGAIAYSDAAKQYVTVIEFDGKSEKCKVEREDGELIEHVFADLAYEITIVFVIETAMLRMKLHDAPTTVEMTVGVHSTLHEAVDELATNTDMMVHRVHLDGRLLDVRRTFAEERIRPDAQLVALEVDAKAPVQRWHRLAIENIDTSYQETEWFEQRAALNFIPRRDLIFFGFAIYGCRKEQKSADMLVCWYVDRVKSEEHRLKLRYDQRNDYAWEINLLELGVNPVPLQKGQTLTLSFVPAKTEKRKGFSLIVNEACSFQLPDQMAWQERAFEVRDSDFAADISQCRKTFPYIIYH